MYIEELLILNFIIDFILLESVNVLLKNNTKRIKLIYSALFGEISLLYLFINVNTLLMIVFKIIMGLVMIFIAFGYNDRKSYFTNLIWFYILSFFLGGTLYYFKINSLLKYKYYLLLVPLIMNIYKYFSYDLRSIFSLKHKVNIYLRNGKVLYLNGYMDTGNTLVDPNSNKKVIIINRYIDEDFFLVPYETIDSRALIRCFKPKKVYIDGIGERNDIVVGIINRKFHGYKCLLNYLLTEKIWLRNY